MKQSFILQIERMQMSQDTPNMIEERVKFFDAMFHNAEPIKTTQGTPRTWRVAVTDDNNDQDLYVYSMNHSDFLYNVDNTRIIATKEKWESEHSTILDPVVNKNEIEEFLQKNPTYGDKTTEELKDDIKKRHYLIEPILISEDGVVWNGNRRLSIVRWLLANEYEQRFEKVPVCKLERLDHDQLKTLEGRLQIKKTYKLEYGTVEVRLRIRQARIRDNFSWDKISKEFGGKWKQSELEDMLNEINFVDRYLIRMQKQKDYAYIYNKGGGSERKGGIEIFRTAATADKSLQSDLMSKIASKQQDPVEYNKRLTAWYQQLSVPDVTHDTIREFNAIMNNDQARKEYFESDDTYQNFSDYTSTMIVAPNGKQIETAFSPEVLKKCRENRITTAPTVQSITHDPKTHANAALKSLKKIELELIPKNNMGFKKTIDNIKGIINKITYSQNYNAS